MKQRVGPAIVLGLVLCGFAAVASAQGLPTTGTGFTPQVPISGFAQPKFGIDPSRLSMSTTFSVGTGFAGQSDALSVTRFGYQFKAPIWMSVSVGSHFGNGGMNQMNSAFFLEGLDFAWRPNPNMLFQVQYKDVRSPLQYDTGLGYIRDPYVVR